MVKIRANKESSLRANEMEDWTKMATRDTKTVAEAETILPVAQLSADADA